MEASDVETIMERSRRSMEKIEEAGLLVGQLYRQLVSLEPLMKQEGKND